MDDEEGCHEWLLVDALDWAGWMGGGVLGVLNGWHFFSGDSDSLLALFVQTRASLETWHIIRGGRKGGR